MRSPNCAPERRKYAIRTRAEATAYLAHPLLGARLRECSQALLSHPRRSALEILGSPDDLKLQSCATLFDIVAPNDVFVELLERFYDGARDARTLRLLGEADGPA